MEKPRPPEGFDDDGLAYGSTTSGDSVIRLDEDILPDTACLSLGSGLRETATVVQIGQHRAQCELAPLTPSKGGTTDSESVEIPSLPGQTEHFVFEDMAIRPAWETDSHAANKKPKQEDIGHDPFLEDGDVEVVKMTRKDWIGAAILSGLSILLVVILIVWSYNGLVPADHIGRSHYLKTRVGHIHSPIFATPVNISLSGAGKEVFDVRLVAMSTNDFSTHTSHRRLGSIESALRMLAGSDDSAPVKTLNYRLLVDDAEFFQKSVHLKDDKELEHFQTVDVAGLGASDGKEYTIEVTTPDGHEVAFMCQVVRMSAVGHWRFVIGAVLFAITFLSILAEKIHRSYSAFLGASAALCLVVAIQEPVGLKAVMGMVSWDTLMLLFANMIVMQMLAVTGFFGWFAVQVIEKSKGNPELIFLVLTNLCGFMSMILNNVTCVLLLGPLTYQIAAKLGLDPRAIYLSMTICTTVGGTATLIGDPPNIVIGTKLRVSFDKFLIVNGPIVGLVLLPVSSAILYYRFKDSLRRPEFIADALPDLAKMKRENRINNEPMLAQFCCTFLAFLLGLLLSPVHDVDPAWFCVMSMVACGLLFDRHDLGKWLGTVEWDTLFFFALLFVFVESLSELGVIREVGQLIVDIIEAFPIDTRMPVALIVILWVSGIGSAFLESLPYTTTITYIIMDLLHTPIDGVDVKALIWPLSIGACVGGIGSIMGSSANLVCMAVSKRFAEREEDRVQGGDFLKYGLPVLVALLAISTVWLLLLFAVFEIQI
eukprot:TRINITY_DN14594_c0_g1_i1.p1 TRINITY_DN14594_c0_g1~~TRINITY_DN14594_c0_g1_i1.p1  ORF type:complete len:766 (+),score=83.31 TRINITY_DN14594_c0_g1_i1:45-2342(+)